MEIEEKIREQIIITIIQVLATIVVAVIGLVGIVVQVNAGKKQEEQKKLSEEINAKITAVQKKSEEDDAKINKILLEAELKSEKRWLIDFMSRAINGETFNMEQTRVATETKQDYNDKGGDSYVDDMWDMCKEQKLF